MFNAQQNKPRRVSPTIPMKTADADVVPAAAAVATPVTIPTDFADDPFKDYRYEDPFSIKDPFADDTLDGKYILTDIL